MVPDHGGLARRRHQVGAFLLKPSQRLVVVVEWERLGVFLRRIKRDPRPVRVEDESGTVSGVEVPTDQAPYRGVEVRRFLHIGGAFRRLNAKQVVKPVTIQADLLKQVGVGQALEQDMSADRIGSGERRGRGNADVASRVQAKQPEHSCLRWRQRAV